MPASPRRSPLRSTSLASRPRRAALAAATALAIAGAASSASADSVMATSDKRPTPRRVEVRLGTVLGSGDIGDARGFSGGLQAAAGIRHGDLGLLAELQYASVGDGLERSMPRRGRATRALALARWNLLSGSPTAPLSGDLWVEGGLGYEHVAWNAGGILDRPIVALGFGTELDARPSPGGKRRHVGPYVGFRTQIGRGPDADVMPTCGGPCTRATRPSPYDASFYVVFGLHTGR